MYDPQLKPKLHDSFEEYATSQGTTVNHFYEKLLLLATRLNTPTACEMGKRRHQLMVDFLDSFLSEWHFNPENEL